MLEHVAFTLAAGVFILIVAWLISWRAAASRTVKAWVRIRVR
jgi:hypothetical protein